MSSLKNTQARGTKADLVRLYRLQPARLNRAFRMSGQCGSDLHQRLRKPSWKFPPKISRCMLGVAAECVLRLLRRPEEMTAETNQDLSLLHSLFHCVSIRIKTETKQQPDILKFSLFVWLVGWLCCQYASRQKTVYPFSCFLGKSLSQGPNQ